jgi:hypothetical protein
VRWRSPPGNARSGVAAGSAGRITHIREYLDTDLTRSVFG